MKNFSRWFVFALLALVLPAKSLGQVFTDSFSQAGSLALQNVSASTAGASTEFGEPLSMLGTVQTVWAKVLVDLDAPLRVTVEGATGFVIVTVYRGASFATLTAVASDSNAETPIAEAVYRHARNESIYVQVATIGSASANLTVRLQPANDRFGTPRNVDWSSISPTLSNFNTTTETGEPDTSADRGHSVWFRWVVPQSARFYVSSQQANFARAIDLYRGENLNSLTRIDGVQQPGESADIGSVVTARAGDVYFVRVQRLGAAFAPEGFFTLYFIPLPPPNDAFVNRLEVASFGPLVGVGSPATLEAGEPMGNDGLTLAGSVWFFLDAPSSGLATFDSLGSEPDTVLRLYTAPTTNGVQFSDLTLIAANDDPSPALAQALVIVPVQAGQRVYAQLGTKAGPRAEGIIQLRASVQPLANVHFTRNRVLWDGGAQPYYVALERSGDASPPLTVGLRWTRFNATQEDVTVSFASGEKLIFVPGTLEFAGPLGGAERTTYELLESPFYDVGTPEFCEVLVEPLTPFVPTRGSFRGMLDRAGHDVRGLGTVQVDTTPTGAYTLRLTIAGRVTVLKGVLDARGRISRVVNVPGLGRQFVDLRVDPLFPAVTGTIGDSVLYAARPLTAALARNFGLAGRQLVFSFLPNDDGPQGAGFALGTIGATGAVRLTGAMPDGRAFALATQIGADFSLPIYASLYDGRGVLHGYFIHVETPSPGWAARGTWVKPATGSGELGAALNQALLGFGEIYLPPAAGAPLSTGFSQAAGAGVALIGLPAEQTLELPFQIGAASVATFGDTTQYQQRLTIDRRTGFFQGSVKLDATAAPYPFRGVFIPGLVIAEVAGYGPGFLIQGSSSRPVRLVPNLGF